jgi:hypothetical protein
MIKGLKDGRILFIMTASGKEKVEAWVISFGPKVGKQMTCVGMKGRKFQNNFTAEEEELKNQGCIFFLLGQSR